MKILGKLISWIWLVLFMSFLAATVYQSSGNKLPEDIARHRDTFQALLNSFLSSWVFGVVFVGAWFAVCYQLGRLSGWQMLAKEYAESESSPKLSGGSGRIGTVPYQGSLQVGAHTFGLALRVLLLFRFGHHNLDIPWSAIDSLSIRRSASPPGTTNLLDKIRTKIFNTRFAHVSLAQFPEQILIVQWNEALQSNIPSAVSVTFEDE